MSSAQDNVSDDLIQEIGAQLDRDAQINCRLAGDGWLHIDRQLPHICVHRCREGDRDTERLLDGMAAYLKADAKADLGELIRTIAQASVQRFGGFLVLEIWRGAAQPEGIGHPPAPGFHIYAPQRHAPNEVLDTLVNALQRLTLRKRSADVKMSFRDSLSPPGLPPLLGPKEAAELGCVVVGLEIRPVYQDESGDRLPFAHRAIHRSLLRALKKTFYRFSHQETVSRPRHYHELGSRALTRVVWDVDERLARISEAFDLLLHVTPVNAARSWEEFENGGYQQAPEFHYRPRSADPALLKRELYSIPLERIGDPTMAELFGAKRDELDRQLTLLKDRGTRAFLHGSIQLFGSLDRELLDTALNIISHSSASPEVGGKNFSAQQLARAAERELAHYRKMDPSLEASVEVRDDVTGILVSHGNFLIGSDAAVAQSRLDATLNHEIGTHALTYHNGRKQPLHQLYAGMAGYEELQEGLAVLAEYLSGGLTLPRLQLLAGRVVAVHNIDCGASFVECFHSLHDDHGFRPFTAYNMTMRVYRGGGYTKDMIYLRGFLELLDYLSREEEVELLYCGKIAMGHLHLLRELRWRDVLRPLALTPRYLQLKSCTERLETLRAEPTIEHIVGNL